MKDIEMHYPDVFYNTSIDRLTNELFKFIFLKINKTKSTSYRSLTEEVLHTKTKLDLTKLFYWGKFHNFLYLFDAKVKKHFLICNRKLCFVDRFGYFIDKWMLFPSSFYPGKFEIPVYNYRWQGYTFYQTQSVPDQ